jgi:primosomal protein N' (replication factor Y)
MLKLKEVNQVKVEETAVKVNNNHLLGGLSTPTAKELFAEIAVDATVLGAGLTYRVPAGLHDLIKPGQLVWVPLKKGKAQGIVISLTNVKPLFTVKDLNELVDERPLLLPHQLELAQWLAKYYYCGLYEAASLFLPAGFARVARPTISLVPASRSGLLPADLGTNELFLVELLREIKPAPRSIITEDGEIFEEEAPADENTSPEFLLEDVRKLYVEKRGKTTFDRAVSNLERLNIAKRGFMLPRPRVKPKVKPFVRLAAWLVETPDDDPTLQKMLKRAAKQKQVIEVLRQELEQGFLIPSDELCQKADTNMPVIKAMAEKGLLDIEEHEVRRDPLSNRPHRHKAEEPPLLTYHQSLVWRSLLDGLMKPQAEIFLLHGVTGSGKTELYLRAISRVLREGKQAIVLVPEIALTAQTVDRFAARFPGKIAVRHSKLSPGEAYDEWRRARDGQADIVIGARSALFAPLERLGLIIIDEEHEWSYKQDDSFTTLLYHAREVAIKMAHITGAKLILGSATPSVESYHRAKSGEFTLLELPERVAPEINTIPTAETHQPKISLPPVQIVDMRQELKSGNTSIFSRDLQRLITQTLKAKQQAILFLNRRGTSTIVMCRDCGHVEMCEACDSPLVWHADLSYLLCHRCGRHYPHPKQCSACNSLKIRHLGAGTKRVEDEVAKLFPTARVLRWDQDVITEGGRDTYQQLYDKMANYEVDILVGTQMIAKGLDLPLVSLVGAVTADTGLFLPDFRSTERTFQILTQVAGRAGRRTGLTSPARVIFQSYNPEQYAIQSASRHSYAEFYKQEMFFRGEHFYPPYAKLIKFVYNHTKEATAKLELEKKMARLHWKLESLGVPSALWSFIGPAPAFQHKLRDQYRYQCVLRINNSLTEHDYHHEQTIRKVVAEMRPEMVHGWTVDVDPQSLL